MAALTLTLTLALTLTLTLTLTLPLTLPLYPCTCSSHCSMLLTTYYLLRTTYYVLLTTYLLEPLLHAHLLNPRRVCLQVIASLLPHTTQRGVRPQARIPGEGK